VPLDDAHNATVPRGEGGVAAGASAAYQQRQQGQQRAARADMAASRILGR
jgi:hypothetical protein